MKQDELFDGVKAFAVEHPRVIPCTFIEKTAPIWSFLSLVSGSITHGETPRIHKNLMFGANLITRARSRNERPGILAWRISSNQIRNDSLTLQIITASHPPKKPIELILPPETQDLLDKNLSCMVLLSHCLGDFPATPKINEVLAKNRGILIASAPQHGLILEKFQDKAESFGLTVANTGDKTAFIRKCARTVKNGGVILLHGDTKADDSEPETTANFLGEEILLRENIFGLAKLLKIPIVPAISTIEKGTIKVFARRPIGTQGKEVRDIAQTWAYEMGELTKEHPTVGFAVFELKFVARR